MLFSFPFPAADGLLLDKSKGRSEVRASFAAVSDGETNPDRVGRSVAVNAV